MEYSKYTGCFFAVTTVSHWIFVWHLMPASEHRNSLCEDDRKRWNHLKTIFRSLLASVGTLRRVMIENVHVARYSRHGVSNVVRYTSSLYQVNNRGLFSTVVS